ncbi:MAG TPA: hypothetical protein VKU36_02360 [Candidatus Babeliales bacterium]|nr:hypothetical protein [Candidatus Babeliales bacterium]
MLHFLLLLLLSSYLFIPSCYSMEPIEQRKPKKYLPIPDFTTRISGFSFAEQSQKISAEKSTNNTVTISTTSSQVITNNTTQTKISPKTAKFSDAYSKSDAHSKTGLTRSKTVEAASGSNKYSIGKIFSKSDSSADTSTHRETSPRGRKPSGGSRIVQPSPHVSPRGKSKSPREKLNLIQAVRNANIETVAAIVNNPHAYLNEEDEWKNKPLHRAVLLLRNPDIRKRWILDLVLIFVNDHRVDSSLINEDNRTAQQLLEGGEDAEIRKLLFARATLDIVTNNHLKTELKNLLSKTYIDNDLVTMVQNIKKKIKGTEKAQEDYQKLPDEAYLPPYATDEFILKMLKDRLPYERKVLEELVAQEACNILLNVQVNDMMITQAVTNIQKEIREKKLFEKTAITPPTNDFIFDMIKSIIDHKKPQTQNILMHMLPQEIEPKITIKWKKSI